MKFKKTLGLFLAVLGTLCVTSCSEETSSIVFWHTMGESNRAQLDAMIVEFNKEYPDIVIEHASQGGFDELKEKISTSISGGNEPSMAFVYPDHVASYLTQQVVVNLDTYIDDEELGFTADEKADIVPTFLAEGTVYNSAGTLYSFPFAKSTEVMYYNKTVFEANEWTVPSTWEEMWTLCKTIKDTDSIKALYDGDVLMSGDDIIPLGYDSEDNMLITMFEQYGIPYTSSSESGDARYQFNNASAASLLTSLQGYYNSGYFTTKSLNEDSYTSTLFTSQGCLMTVGSTGGASYNEPAADANTGKYDFEYDIATLPQAENGTDAAILQGPSLCLFDKGETMNEQAWLFLKFITNTENSASYASSTGYMPVRTSSLSETVYTTMLSQDNIVSKTLKVAGEQMDMYFTSDTFNGSSNARIQIGFVMEYVCLSGISAEEALQKAYDDLTK